MSGDWGGYRKILEQAQEDAKAERENPPATCPIDGERLERHPTKELWNCPLGNYRTTSLQRGC